MAPSTSATAQVFHLIFNCHGRKAQSTTENKPGSHQYPVKEKRNNTHKCSVVTEKQNVGIASYSAVSIEQQAHAETERAPLYPSSASRIAIQSTVWSRCSSHSIMPKKSRPSLFGPKTADQQVLVDPIDEMAAMEAEKEDAQTAWAQKKTNSFTKEKVQRPSTRRRISSMFDSKLKKNGAST